MSTESMEEKPTPALLQVHRGNPRPEELAALVAVVTAAASNSNGNGESNGPLERWGDLSQALDSRGHYSFAPRSYANGSLGRY